MQSIETMPQEFQLEAARQLAKTDLKYLCTKILGFTEWDICHDDLVNFLAQSRSRFKMILMPRETYKTSIVTIAKSIQHVLQDPNVSIMFASAVLGNSESFLEQVRDYFTSKSNLRHLFGDFVSEVWNSERIVVKQRTRADKTPTITPSGVDKSVVSQHYDVIFADDLVTRKTVNTLEQMEKTRRYYSDLMDLLKKPNGILYVVGTRWDNKDLYGGIIEEEDKLAESGNPRTFDIHVRKVVEDGKIINPKKFTFEILKDLRAKKGSYDFSCQYENDPTSPTNRIFKPPFRHWQTLPDKMAHVITVDPAISKKKDSCDAIVLDSAMSESGQLYLVDCGIFTEEKKHPKNLIDCIIEFHLKYGTRTVGIEAVGYQEVLCLLLQDELEKRKLFMDIVPIHNDDDKARRIICLQPLWEGGNILLKPGMTEAEDQFDLFRKPIVAKCDILDALASRLKVPPEFITFTSGRSSKNKEWHHPAVEAAMQRNKVKNPYQGRALPESEWRKLQGAGR